MSALEILAALSPLTGGERSAIRDLQRELHPRGEATFLCESATGVFHGLAKLSAENVHRKGW